MQLNVFNFLYLIGASIINGESHAARLGARQGEALVAFRCPKHCLHTTLSM